MRLVATTMAQARNVAVRPTGLGGTVCVLKQPHHSFYFIGLYELLSTVSYCPKYNPMASLVFRTVASAMGATRAYPALSTASR